MISVIMPASTDKDLVFEEDYANLFNIALQNMLTVEFQAGARPGPWCIQGPDPLDPLFGDINLERAINKCLADLEERGY